MKEKSTLKDVANNYLTHTNNKKGITLIALVITIVVLLILAGITIATLTGDNGIITRANQAKTETEQAEKEEKNDLEKQADFINEYTTGIDWDTVLANAQKHPDQKTSTAVGVGIDGKPVNMDLWQYTLLDNGTYALNSEETITAVKEENWALAKSGYLGIFTEDGKIQGMIPQFIKDVTDDNFVAVTDMTYLFYNCTDLREMPQIPETIENMCNTFSGCANLKESVKIPNSVKNLQSTFMNCINLTTVFNIPNEVIDMSNTFYACSNLTSVPNLPNSVEKFDWTFHDCSNLKTISNIPNNITTLQGTFSGCVNLVTVPEILSTEVTDMKETFSGCTNLNTISNIPLNVEDMTLTFYNCSNLRTIPEIPSSVTNMRETFSGCSSLNGTITINANLSGAIVWEDKNDYYAVLWNAATNSGCEIRLTGTCPVLKEIVTTTNRDNITL